MHAPHHHRLIAILIAIPLLLLARPAPAQEPEAKKSTGAPDRCVPAVAQRDSMRMHPPHGYLLAVMAGFIVAPPALLRLPGFACEDRDDRPLGLLRDHVAVFVGGGGLITGEWKGGPAGSVDAEAVVRHVYADVRGEQYWFTGDRIRMWDARVGYLYQPVRTLAGGITVGYRGASGAPGDWGVEGVQIGLPLVIGACPESSPCWIHWEPTYVFSRGHLRVSPRARVDMTLPRTPLLVRLDIDSKGVRSENPFVATLSLGLRP
ncbi:hypothetical protein [Longimicrobium sp.]|uniref:hypothetical protein n=1 Tax=Longimicrobium sp. TaxID=2029185 RepID=UPI002C4EFB88|nr:hypothetical protein [Longimicrobium sp.]HSU16118.1 hypothetical protein [Longimicrobium sp.]